MADTSYAATEALRSFRQLEQGGTSGGDMTYNPDKRQWESTGANSTAPQPSSDESSPSEKTPTPQSSPETDSQAKAEKEYKEIEYNTLEGETAVVPCDDTVRLKVGNTVKLEGVGKYLSGLYFISSIKRTINDSGYSQTLTLIKTGFGDSLKKPAPTPREDVIEKPAPSFSAGDKVKIVGADATYSNAHEGVKVPDWVKEEELTIDAVSEDGTRVRLMPIYSWTYVKNIQKL